ncbi:unnamed protein product, partial [Brassica rapa subsp. narinosa]
MLGFVFLLLSLVVVHELQSSFVIQIIPFFSKLVFEKVNICMIRLFVSCLEQV